MTNPVLITAAVLPALYLLYCIYQADRVEKEPAGLLVSLAISGIIATFLAMVTESIGYMFVSGVFWEGSVLYNFFFYFFVVALSEEGFKYLLLKKRTWNSPAFNCRFDGVVYAVFVSLGFALWENISYVGLYGLEVALLRAVTAIPGHACFGVFMGVWYGLAKKFDMYGNEEKAKRYRKLAVVCPILLHGSYDFIASMENSWFTLVFIAFMAGLFHISLRMVRQQANRDHYLDGVSYKSVIR